MLHILPVLCLIGFALFVEFRLQKEIMDITKRVEKPERAL